MYLRRPVSTGFEPDTLSNLKEYPNRVYKFPQHLVSMVDAVGARDGSCIARYLNIWAILPRKEARFVGLGTHESNVKRTSFIYCKNLYFSLNSEMSVWSKSVEERQRYWVNLTTILTDYERAVADKIKPRIMTNMHAQALTCWRWSCSYRLKEAGIEIQCRPWLCVYMCPFSPFSFEFDKNMKLGTILKKKSFGLLLLLDHICDIYIFQYSL